MTTLSIEIPQARLLEAVGQLDSDALNRFVEEVLLLRAQRVAPSIKKDEAQLLHQIESFTLAIPERKRFHQLIEAAEAGTMSQTENAEYIQLAEQSERLNAKRIAAIIRLANLWQRPFDDVMKQLGLWNLDGSSAT